MTWRIEANLVFPHFMNPSEYDAGVTVWDWFEDRDAPELETSYASEAEAKAAIKQLRKRYLGKDVHGVSCQLTAVED